MELSAEFDDRRSNPDAIARLARLHCAGGDKTLPAAEVTALFAQALGDGERFGATPSIPQPPRA